MKKKNESGKTNSTRLAAKQPQKQGQDGLAQGEQTHCLVPFETTTGEMDAVWAVAKANGQTAQQLIAESVWMRLRAEKAGATAKGQCLADAWNDCEALRAAMLQAVSLLRTLPTWLIKELKAREAHAYEMETGEGLEYLADGAANGLKMTVDKVFADVTRLRSLDYKPA